MSYRKSSLMADPGVSSHMSLRYDSFLHLSATLPGMSASMHFVSLQYSLWKSSVPGMKNFNQHQKKNFALYYLN